MRRVRLRFYSWSSSQRGRQRIEGGTLFSYWPRHCGGLTGCLKWPVENSSTQPDEVLFERGMSAVEDDRFDVAHIIFQTLINTYPDSEYASKAAVALEDPRITKCGESWSFSPGCDEGYASAPPTN